ncbi:MAG: ATP-dependent RecD-like DNA helicase [Candidatus Schekmanbacteria bacterium]|nr:ATP-dependent RecD-like DNA helicase [Candidatus Schekmanbacteria bacterium]
MAVIQGMIDRIIYNNEENGYTVLKILVDDKSGVTAVGNMQGISAGETLRLEGEWITHKKFGEQFRVDLYKWVFPKTRSGIEKYLASGLIKGVGPVLAKRLVDAYGDKVIDVLDNSPQLLKDIEGIGEKKLAVITKSWSEQKGIRDVMIFLQSFGISPAYASRIYKTYGSGCIPILKENPYRLAYDIIGIGFKTADKIALASGFDKSSPERAKAALLYQLGAILEDGHVCYPEDLLIDECVKLLEHEEKEVISGALQSLILEGLAIREENISPDRRSLIYLRSMYEAEQKIADYISSVCLDGTLLPAESIELELAEMETVLKIRLAHEQKEAINCALKNRLAIITGGPGTGKTTILKFITRLCKRRQLKALLAAPTGRAAKRLSEVTGMEAKTIHRLLEYNPNLGGFQKNGGSQLKADIIILDEASMIDIPLFSEFLEALPQNMRLLMVGDIYQLPSVGPGNLLRDLIESKRIPVVRLEKIFRQEGNSNIITNAHRINSGEFPFIPKFEQSRRGDFYFFQEEEPDKVLKIIENLYCKQIPDKFGFNPFTDIQVLTPMHKGTVGAMNLNSVLQNILNPQKQELVRGSRIFRVNDKVMQIKNNYEKDVFNGDMGRITSIDFEEQTVVVDFDSSYVHYDFSELDELALAYAISIHKSQGSEYKAVIVPILVQHYFLLQRNLIYTAVTRGKQLVIMVGTKKAIGMAISNNRVQERYTLLKERITT